MGELDTAEEALLEVIDNLWHSLDYDHVTYSKLDKHINALGSYLRGHYVGVQNMSSLYLIKTYLRPVTKSRFKPTKTIGDLYKFMYELNWVQLHPYRNHSAEELVKMIADRKEEERDEAKEYARLYRGDN